MEMKWSDIMKEKVDKLVSFLKEQDKENATKLCLNYLEKEELTVTELYEKVLTPALNNIIFEFVDNEDELIWNEHVRSGIIRSIVELSYPHVLKERKANKNNNINVIVMCPRFEDHELGARMVADFFTIAGFNTTFIGSNTPEKTVLKAVQSIKPKYIVISVTNYFNLVATKKTMELINSSTDKSIKYILGGSALKDESELKNIGGDYLLRSYNDILNLEGVDDDEVGI